MAMIYWVNELPHNILVLGNFKDSTSVAFTDEDISVWQRLA
jgi:hypothetical protein